MRLAGIAIAIGGALVCSACNIVVSDEPMFGDEADAPELRPGIWAGDSEKPCDFDTSLPLREWPECANAIAIEPSGGFASIDEESGELERSEMSYQIGDPSLMELMVEENPFANGDEDAGPLYLYSAYRPVTRDAAGMVIEFRGWFVYCGPTVEGQGATESPFEGLTMYNGACFAKDVAALRNAAAESEKLDVKIGRARWVRDLTDTDLKSD